MIRNEVLSKENHDDVVGAVAYGLEVSRESVEQFIKERKPLTVGELLMELHDAGFNTDCVLDSKPEIREYLLKEHFSCFPIDVDGGTVRHVSFVLGVTVEEVVEVMKEMLKEGSIVEHDIYRDPTYYKVV